MLGQTLQGHIEPGLPTMMQQIEQDGRTSVPIIKDSSSLKLSSSTGINCARRARICSGAPIAALSIGTAALCGRTQLRVREFKQGVLFLAGEIG